MLGRKDDTQEEFDHARAAGSNATRRLRQGGETRRQGIADALMNNDDVLRGNNVIKYVPESSVSKLRAGDAIKFEARKFL